MPGVSRRFAGYLLAVILMAGLPQIGSAADMSPILGFWSLEGQGCGDNSYFEITKSGASGPEEICNLVSLTRKANRFTLRQRCEVEGMVSESSIVLTLVNSKAIEVNGLRYRRCKPAWQ